MVQRQRTRGFECEITRQVTEGIRVNVESLNLLAGQRADQAEHDYGHDFPELGRPLEREALEELADARNYIVWRLDAIHRGLDDQEWRVQHLQIALRHVALAFEEIRSAE